MRKIDFAEPHTEAWKKWRARCIAATNNARKQVAKGKRPIITGLYKSQKAFYLSKDRGFFGKCAYCEQLISSNQHCDLDHYRPKKGPTDMNWAPIRRTKKGKLVPHPGYYWLAYDWKNLLLTCQLCNQVPENKSYGKGTRFPVLSKYAWTPGKEKKEEPLLLHPCLDDPAIHLDIDKTGVFSAKTKRGDATINLLGLNFRDLPDYRAELFGEIEDKFLTIIARRKDIGSDAVFEAIAALSADKVQYSGTAKVAVIAARNSIMALLGP